MALALGDHCMQIVVSYLEPHDLVRLSELCTVNLKLYLQEHRGCAFGRASSVHARFEQYCRKKASYLVVCTNYTARLVDSQEDMLLFRRTQASCDREDDHDDRETGKVDRDPHRFDHCSEPRHADILKNALAIHDPIEGSGIYLRRDVCNPQHPRHGPLIVVCTEYADCIVFDLHLMRTRDIDISWLVQDLRDSQFCNWFETTGPKPVELRNGVLLQLVIADTESG